MHASAEHYRPGNQIRPIEGAEQRVSRNKNISAIKVLARIRFKEQADSARRMARRGNNAPCHIAQAQLIAIFQEMINLA